MYSTASHIFFRSGITILKGHIKYNTEQFYKKQNVYFQNVYLIYNQQLHLSYREHYKRSIASLNTTNK